MTDSSRKRVRWGVLGAAKIALRKVIPGMQAGKHCTVVGVASRDQGSARRAADELGLSQAYGSYEDLLADPNIDAVYIPLPNHLHVPWAIRALEAGKHVLCEKPIALDAEEAERLQAAATSFPDLKVMEAFMYRFHPQWVEAKRLVDDGEIGELRAIQSAFSYFNDDPANIRNVAAMGGGGLMDIGCYCISLSRWLFGAEPDEVVGAMDIDPRFGVDRLASGLLRFGGATSIFTCSTQMVPYQRVTIFGTAGLVEIEIPFNAPPDRPCRIWHERDGERRSLVLEAADQYTIQGDAFSLAVLDGTDVPTPLEDAVANMKVIDRLMAASARR